VHHRSGAGRLASYRQTLQLLANWRRSSIANTCGCRCIHLRFVGCLNKRIFIYLFYFICEDLVLKFDGCLTWVLVAIVSIFIFRWRKNPKKRRRTLKLSQSYASSIFFASRNYFFSGPKSTPNDKTASIPSSPIFSWISSASLPSRPAERQTDRNARCGAAVEKPSW